MGILAWGSGAARAGAARRPRVILCCETYSLRDMISKGALTLEGVPALYKELNIPGISWNDKYFTSWETSYLDDLKRAVKASGRVTSCLIMEGNLATNDENARRKQLDEDIRKLKAAAYLGAPVVRVNLGGTGRDADDDTVGVERCIAAFNEMLPLAKSLNVKLTIENHGGCSRTADRILKVIHGTDRKWVGSCMDFGNWPYQPTELRYTEMAKLAPYAYHVHAKSHRFNPDGEEGDIDYKRVLGMLRDANYRGAISVEWEGVTPRDSVEAVKLTRDLIRKYWPGI